MKKVVNVIAGLSFAAILAGCTTITGGNSSLVGPGANNNVVTDAILQAMDTGDQSRMNQALSTVRDKQPFAWQNAGNGNQFQLLPNRTYVNEQGQPCRAITFSGMIRGQKLTSNCDACRISDGSWSVIG